MVFCEIRVNFQELKHAFGQLASLELEIRPGSGSDVLWRADLSAPIFDFGFDAVANFADACELCLSGALKGRWVWETPMKARSDAGEDGATFGAGLVANGDDVGESVAGFVHVEHGLGLIAGNVYADFLHNFDNDWIELSGLEAGAVGFKLFAANVVQVGFSHLAAGAVVDADKEHSLSVHSSTEILGRG
jgi:hypothetical protein